MPRRAMPRRDTDARHRDAGSPRARLGVWLVEAIGRASSPAALDRRGVDLGDEVVRLAIAQGLGRVARAGIAATGLGVSPATEERLAAAARREAVSTRVADEETHAILALLARRGVAPIVLKGRSLDERWGGDRPPGDLDLLLAPGPFDAAARVLAEAGYRAAPAPPPSRFRPAPLGVELWPPTGKRVAVDLHVRPFRTVGARVDAAALVLRAQPFSLGGVTVARLDPIDELHVVAVHAAKHAVRSLKWLTDLHVLDAAADDASAREARARAVASGTDRAFDAALGLLARIGRDRRGRPAIGGSSWPFTRALDRLITLEGAVHAASLTRLERYLLEVALEPALAPRARRAAGLVERLLRDGAASFAGRLGPR